VGPITIVWPWIISDVVMLAAGIAVVWYIVKREPHPASRLIEVAAFTFLYAGIYENLATWIGWYEYGRSLIMFGNVPVAVLLYEAIVFYAGLKLMERLAVPAWIRPIGAGFLAVMQDFAIDTLTTHQLATTQESATPIGHWTFLTPPTDVQIYGEPVMNFSSWMFLVGVYAAFAVIGRWWHRRSGYARWVGIVYPLLAVIASLGVLMSPLSRLVLFGRLGYDGAAWTEWPVATPAQWWILGAFVFIPPLLIALTWRGRFTGELSPRRDWPILAVLVGVPLFCVVAAVAGGMWDVLWLIALSTAAMAVLVGLPYVLAARAAHEPERAIA